MDDDQQFCLRWNNHQSTLISVFDTLLENQTLVDCTLAAEGKFLKAHKVVLSACSPYFATLLQEQYDKHPIFILKDVKFQELRAMMDYMYRGEVNISQDQLAALLKAAESLQIKGLSDNRSASNTNTAPKLDGSHHRNLNVGGNVGSKIGGGYTLEQTKRTRLGPNAMEAQEMSGSREGSSSPSRRRKKVRRRSIEAPLADIQHDNSNSSANQTAMQQSTVAVTAPGLSNVNPITAAVSVLAGQLPSSAIPGAVVGTSQAVASSSSAVNAATGLTAAAAAAAAAAAQQLITNVTKKTESLKGAASSENMNTEDLAAGVNVDDQEQQQANSKVDKHNHKHKGTSGKDASDIVVEPKSEYDDDGNEGTVEDLTLDEEDMGMDDLDQNAGTSHVGEGSSQGYVPWQHERSQDDLLMAPQDVQQRDPQGVSEAIAKLTTSKYAVQFKESPKTSRANTPTPGSSFVLKYDTDIGTNDCKIDEMSAPGAAETSEDEDEQPRDLRYRSINNIVSALQRAQVSDAASRAALAAMIRRPPGTTVTPGMPFHSITAVTSSSAGNTTPNVSPQLPLLHAHQTLLNFPPPSPPRSFTSSLMPPTRVEVTTSGGSSVVTVGAGTNVPSTNASNINSSVTLTPTTSITVTGSSSGGPAWGGAYTCDRCGNSYARPHSLNRHVRFECGVEPKFECPICHKKSKHKHNLVLHMRTHQHR